VLVGDLTQSADRIDIGHGIDFAGAQNHRFSSQRLTERRQFAHQHFEIVDRIAPGFGNIDQMNQQTGALDVPQKLNSEAVAFVRAFDDAGNIGHNERAVIAELNDAEVRFERGERVIGDLGSGGGDARDQRALAGIRKADQTHIGQEFEFQPQLELVAFLARFVLGGRLMRRGGEPGIAFTAAAAARDGEHLTGRGEIEELLAGLIVVDDGADRDVELDRSAVLAVAVGTFAVTASLGGVFGIEAIAKQRVFVNGGSHDDVAAAAAIAAGGPAAGDVFLAAESEAAVAAVAGLHQDSSFVNKHVISLLWINKSANKKAGNPQWIACPGIERVVKKMGLRGRSRRFRCRDDRVDTDVLAHPSAISKLHDARDLGEQRVIRSPADVQTGLDAGTALADDNRPPGNQLAAEALNAEPLCIGIAAVFGTA
jgi:hypothetical protein